LLDIARCSTSEHRNNGIFDRISLQMQSNRSYPIGLRGQLSETHIQAISSEGTEQMVSSEGAEDQNTAAGTKLPWPITPHRNSQGT
jgi:hypothetical protein